MSAAVQSPVLTLDKEAHVYSLDGRPLPSVTAILKGAGLVDDQWFDEKSRARGHAVHALCHYEDEGDLKEETLDERLHGYLTAYRKFKADTGFVSSHNEQRIYNANMDYAGTLDGLGTFERGHCIHDIKSGAVAKVTRYQLVAYACCLPSPRKYWRVAVALKPEGKYSLKVYSPQEYDRDFKKWQSIVDVFHLRKELGQI